MMSRRLTVPECGFCMIEKFGSVGAVTIGTYAWPTIMFCHHLPKIFFLVQHLGVFCCIRGKCWRVQYGLGAYQVACLLSPLCRLSSLSTLSRDVLLSIMPLLRPLQSKGT